VSLFNKSKTVNMKHTKISVSKVTCYGQHEQASISNTVRDSSLCHCVQASSQTNQPPVQEVLGAPPLRVKWMECTQLTIYLNLVPMLKMWEPLPSLWGSFMSHIKINSVLHCG
jgi:hypothetical protein